MGQRLAPATRLATCALTFYHEARAGDGTMMG